MSTTTSCRRKRYVIETSPSCVINTFVMSVAFLVTFLLSSAKCAKTLRPSHSSHPECNPLETNPTSGRYLLSETQNRMCQMYPDHMPTIRRGARMAIKECEDQLRWRRWNCSSVADDVSLFGTPVNAAANRETAFVQALTSAGVSYAVSRACREGDLPSCGCSGSRDDSSHRRVRGGDGGDIAVDDGQDWQWNGCADGIEYGYKFAGAFADARYKEKNNPRHSMELARTLTALHNNEAGRLVVMNFATVGCKCHGVSGACTMKTCWQQLPAFGDVGDRLRTSYDAATKVAFSRHGTYLLASPDDSGQAHLQAPVTTTTTTAVLPPHRATKKKRKRKRGDAGRRPSKDELVFVENSIDYCGASRKGGLSKGPVSRTQWTTKGRRCLRSSKSAVDSCEVLCCGRGYNSFRETIVERCKCRFVWCCKVTCSTCQRQEDVNVCK